LKDRAINVLQQIVDERFDKEKGVAHGAINDSWQLYGMLSDHIRLGVALVEAFRTTDDALFLQQAEALAQTTQELLEDGNGGGFFDRPASYKNLGLLNIPTKPARENIQAVRWYLDLFHLTGKDIYRLTAERTLASVVGTPQPLPIALIGLAVDEWFRPLVHIAVVGMPDDVEIKALWDEAGRLYCPRKVVKAFDPQQSTMKWGEITFPYDGKAAAFICTDQMCLAPVYQAEGMAERLKELLSEARESVL
jgi:uncharacterized protein YyaL (SSP411 family)